MKINNLDKLKIKHQLEESLILLMLRTPDFAYEVFEKIEVEEISEKNRTIFEEIRDHKPYTFTNILNEIKIYLPEKSKAYLDTMQNISEGDKYELQGTIEKYLSIHTDIELDRILLENINDSAFQIQGFQRASELRSKFDELLTKSNRFNEIKTFDENIPEIIKRIESDSINQNQFNSESFQSFNNATSGINPGNLITIAGALKNGKTTFGLNLIYDFSGQGYSTAVFSLEMTASEVENKIIGMKTGIAYKRIRNKSYTDSDKRKLLLLKKGNQKISIFDRINTITGIETQSKRIKNKYGLDFVLIDYIGLIKTITKYKNIESREREISSLSSSLKLFAKDLNCAVIIISQLNRNGLKDATSFNLAESIGLARDSDFLFTIYKPYDIGVKQFTIPGDTIEVNENHFLVKLENSRHTPSGKQFLLEMDQSGIMRELASQLIKNHSN
jgi:replicative DNA helicase